MGMGGKGNSREEKEMGRRGSIIWSPITKTKLCPLPMNARVQVVCRVYTNKCLTVHSINYVYDFAIHIHSGISLKRTIPYRDRLTSNYPVLNNFNNFVCT